MQNKSHITWCITMWVIRQACCLQQKSQKTDALLWPLVHKYSTPTNDQKMKNTHHSFDGPCQWLTVSLYFIGSY